MGLHLEPPTGADSVEVPVDGEFQHVRGIVAGAALVARPNPLESSGLKVEAVDEMHR